MTRTIPVAQFAVVKDRQRQMIVGSGTWETCVELAKNLNTAYQSTAYVPERWKTT